MGHHNLSVDEYAIISERVEAVRKLDKRERWLTLRVKVFPHRIPSLVDVGKIALTHGIQVIVYCTSSS